MRMSKAKLQVYVDEALFRRLRIRAAEVGEPMSALVERALRKELGAMEDRETFARHLGYASWDDLLAASEEVAIEGDISWYVTRLPDGRWAAWDDAEIALDRVSLHATRDEAVAYQWDGWMASHEGEEETERVRWLAERLEQ